MDTVALILVIIGALNWGSVGIFNIDLVASIFGGTSSVISRIIFTPCRPCGALVTLLFRETDSAPGKKPYCLSRKKELWQKNCYSSFFIGIKLGGNTHVSSAGA